MKNLLTVLTTCLLVSACGSGTFLEVGAGYNGNLTGASEPWENGGCVGFYGAARQEWPVKERVTLVAQYSHLSQWDCGKPFNNKRESSVDHIGVGLRFKAKEW